jgi:hypothetical protein
VWLGDNISKSGQALGKENAVAKATRVINEALAQKGCGLSRPDA